MKHIINKGDDYNKYKSTNRQSKDKKDINIDTAFYRKIQMEHDAKKWQNYPKYFSLPPFFNPRGHKNKMIAPKADECSSNVVMNTITNKPYSKRPIWLQQALKKFLPHFCHSETKKNPGSLNKHSQDQINNEIQAFSKQKNTRQQVTG